MVSLVNEILKFQIYHTQKLVFFVEKKCEELLHSHICQQKYWHTYFMLLKDFAGLRSTVGSAPDSSWAGYPVWPHTFVSPSTDSRGAFVSYWQKYVHEVLVNHLGRLSLPRRSVVRLTDCPDMTSDVYRGHKTIKQQTTTTKRFNKSLNNDFVKRTMTLDSVFAV